MKKILLLITIAVGFTIAQADEPKYDDDTRCNTAGESLSEGIYEPLDACEQTGYVCKLASDPSGSVFFWLGKTSDCTKLHTTKITTYFSKQKKPNELDPENPNHKLRITLSPGDGYATTFGTAVMASQLLSAKMDNALVSVIYKFVPSPNGADLNSIRLLSVGRVR